jgi:hypothetical protein
LSIGELTPVSVLWAQRAEESVRQSETAGTVFWLKGTLANSEQRSGQRKLIQEKIDGKKRRGG